VRVLAATRHRVARPVAMDHHAPLAPRALARRLPPCIPRTCSGPWPSSASGLRDGRALLQRRRDTVLHPVPRGAADAAVRRRRQGSAL